MESNKTIAFRIICNDPLYLGETIDWYNRNYNTDFKITGVLNDEVKFAEITVSVYEPSDLFELGYQFAVKEEKLRQQKKINW